MGKTPAAAKPEEAKQVAIPAQQGGVPAYLKDVKSDATSNMRAEDLIIPRIQLLQALSPQVEANPREVFAGCFWHNVLDEYVGNPEGDKPGQNFEFIAFRSRFYYMLFAPRGDQRTVLARADDGIHWVPSSGEFKVKPKKSPNEVTYKMAKTVDASGLAKFGSSIPGDPNSQPAATMIYEYLAYLPAHPEFGPVVISLARSQVKRGKVVNTSIEMGKNTNTPMTAFKFEARVTKEQGDEGPYSNWMFKRAGWATEDEFKKAEEFATRFKDVQYKAAGEEEYANDGSEAPKDEPKMASKKGF